METRRHPAKNCCITIRRFGAHDAFWILVLTVPNWIGDRGQRWQYRLQRELLDLVFGDQSDAEAIVVLVESGDRRPRCMVLVQSGLQVDCTTSCCTRSKPHHGYDLGLHSASRDHNLVPGHDRGRFDDHNLRLANVGLDYKLGGSFASAIVNCLPSDNVEQAPTRPVLKEAFFKAVHVRKERLHRR